MTESQVFPLTCGELHGMIVYTSAFLWFLILSQCWLGYLAVSLLADVRPDLS